MSTTRLTNALSLLIRGLGILAVGILAIVAMPGRAQALSMTFTCQVLSSTTTPDVCVEGGSGPGANPNFGVLTLTDNANDSRRVDISWAMTPQWGYNVERVLLNFTEHAAAAAGGFSDLRLIAPGAGVGSTGPAIAGSTAIFGSNGQGQGTTYQFDIRLGENQPAGLTFLGSMVLFNAGPNPDTLFDLNPEHFLSTSNNLSGATPALYALYTTNQSLISPGPVSNPAIVIPEGWTISNGNEFWAGVTSVPNGVVPEPASLLLLGTGLLGLGVARRFRRA